MPIDFHDEKNQFTYSNRSVDPIWSQMIRTIINPKGKLVLDIGCGGGIYSRVWAELGATKVIGIDFSEQMISAATEKVLDLDKISFKLANALDTGLDNQIADIVFERALIHHISDLPACLAEAFRLLKPGGMYLIQDRTPEDVRVPASSTHIRGYYFECFPKLHDIEEKRRFSLESVTKELEKQGFSKIETHSLWETRHVYSQFSELKADLLDRKGRSILHELNEKEMIDLITYIQGKIPVNTHIFEKDKWTFWSAIRI